MSSEQVTSVMPIRRAPGTPPKESAPSTAADQEPDAVSDAAEEEEEDAAPSSPAPKDTGGDAEEASDPEPKENGEEADEAAAGKKGDDAVGEDLALPAVTKGPIEKCKDCEAGQCTTHCYVLLIRLKDGKLRKAKLKKKKTIPAWATVTASKKFPVTNFAGSQPKVDTILIEAVKSSEDKSGISMQSLMKYIVKNYPGLELDKRKFLLKKSLKKHLEQGTIKQLKGKGLSGSFVIGKKLPEKVTTTTNKKGVVKTSVRSETLGDALPLMITRLCEPKEASYMLIKKYVEQHFPHLNIDNKPDLLKSALARAVDKGQLERLTGKGATGTFQLKRSGDKVLLKGKGLEDAICAAITAMNEPKTCSTTILKRFLIDSNKDANGSRLVRTLKQTLTKCKVKGWMEQITGKGFSGTYQLSFPFYPSPSVLFPDMDIAPPKKKTVPRRRTVDSDEEESEEEEDSDDSDDEPPAKRKAVKRGPPKVRKPPPAKNSRSVSKSKTKSKVTPAKKPKAAAKKKAAASPAKKAAVAKKAAASPVKKSAGSAKKAASKEASAPPAKKATPAKKAAPVKKAAPAKKPKTPTVKTLPRRGDRKRSAPVKEVDSDEDAEEEEEEVVKKPAAKKGAAAKPKSARKSGRGKK